jgi:O-antigen/teichoic acid export membrane protein
MVGFPLGKNKGLKIMKLMALSAVVVKSYPLVTVPLFLYFFTKEEFGALDYAYYVMSLGCVLLTFGINNGYGRYALDSTIEVDLRIKKYSYFLLSSILIAVIAAISVLIIKLSWLYVEEWIPPALQKHTDTIALYTVSGALAHTVLTAERFSLNARSLIVATLVIYILPLFAVVFVYIALGKVSINTVLLLNAVFNIFAFGFGFYRSIVITDVDRILILCRRYIIFSSPLLIVLVSESFINFSGRLFLTRLYPDGLGDYAIASRVASILLIFNFFISFMFSPIYYRDKNKPSFVRFWNSLYSLFIIFYCFAITIVPSFITLSLPYIDKLYDSNITLLIILIVGANLLAGLQMFHLGMHVKERTNVIGFIYLIGIPVAFFLNLILITRYQLIGAGLALFSTMIFITVPYIYCSNKASENKLITTYYAKSCIALTLANVLILVRGNGNVNFFLLAFFSLATVSICMIAIKSTLRLYNESYSNA